MRVSLADHSPDLLKEWDYDKNEKKNISPNTISYGSKEIAYWICKNGHSWEAPIYRRSGKQKSGCPYCSNQKVKKGYNDLASRYPDLLKEWNYNKNTIKPDNILYGSSIKVWWICPKCNYEWNTAVVHRTRGKGTGCPKCALETLGRNNHNKSMSKSSLSIKYPHLLKEWDYTKNTISPDDISSHSSEMVWWICDKGHSWNSRVNVRTSRSESKCPVCQNRRLQIGINDLKTLYPILINEWDFNKNNKLGLYPDHYTSKSEVKVWWICPLCNESYLTAIKNRTGGTSCPKCANEYRTSFPEQAIYYYLKREFDDTQNRFDLIGYEADIFIPSMNLAIEYDGDYYHNTNASLKREKEKYEQMKDVGVLLIRVREKNLKQNSYADYTINQKKKNSDKELISTIKEIFDFITDIYNININPEIDLEKDRQYIYNQYIKQIKENSIEKLYPNEIKDWDYNKNILKPSNISPGSEKKVWWICSKGHSYEQQVSNHIKGARCPYCSGLKVIKGENDLETLFPDIAKEWDYNKNKKKPSDYKYGANVKAWWICPKGHSYIANISHRTGKKNTNCPICCNKIVLKGYNDLKSQRPDLIKEWDFNKNTISPDEITCGNDKKAWWICPKGHSYESVIHSRANNNTGCPVCNGKLVIKGINDFESQQPELMNEWNYDKNNELGIFPDKIHYHSWKRVWWICKNCNYEWMTSPGKRSEGTGCRICSNKNSGLLRNKRIIEKNGSLLDNYPEIAKEWDYDKNNTRPEEYTSKSPKKAWWVCSKCNFSWYTQIKVRTSGCGCPKCKNVKNEIH